MRKLLTALFDGNEREIKRLRGRIQEIVELEPVIMSCSDDELTAYTPAFKQRLANGESLDSLLPEAFAVVREVAKRSLGLRHFDVQLMGGIVLHQGRIAEMKTGEGKTLVATLPCYLNALTGQGVHVVTVNDYLAHRDSEWMGRVYRFLGLEVGLIVHGMEAADKRRGYQADITYGTNNEFGFDYLRDNMTFRQESMVQRELSYGIVDEVDSILIDEARTPLIISGPSDKPTELYYKFARVASSLNLEEHFIVDEKANSVHPTEEGEAKVEQMLSIDNLSDPKHAIYRHALIQALKARTLMKRDHDYVVKDGQVIIVDEFTGRLMMGRRYSDGLHQAIEAKEGVRIERESQTLATITFQNYFRMYDKLAGMTGTAKTEEEEFQKIYGMDVVVVPTNKPMIRADHPDVIYRTEQGKFESVIEEIKDCHERRQPVLVGTVSIETSERLSKMLRRKGVSHQVLNAKYHDKEADIIKEAGMPGAVTIATNMAGRGTDIVLGGSIDQAQHEIESDEQLSVEEKSEAIASLRAEWQTRHDQVVASGGLHIIGTERHEARRIDNQLRGRSGRQGDPGSSRFFLSLEDDLMRLFGSDSIAGLMDRMGMDDSQPIAHPLVGRALETAQKRVESRNFDIRKQVLEYDDVMNKQRELVYGQRRLILQGADLKSNVLDWLDELLEDAVTRHCPPEFDLEEYDLRGLITFCEALYLQRRQVTLSKLEGLSPSEIGELLTELGRQVYADRESKIGVELMREFERIVLLQLLDRKWKDHLRDMDDLRDGIGLRAYGQQDPLIAYNREAYDMFQSMVGSFKEESVRYAFKAHVSGVPQTSPAPITRLSSGSETNVDTKKKIGRNDPCPCNSGKKYKKCCGR